VITVTVRIPTPLRPYADGLAELTLEGATIHDVLQNMAARHDGLVQRLLTPEGELRRYVNVFVGSDNISARQGLATPLSSGDVVSIIPAVAGGSGRGREQRLAALRAEIAEVEPRQAQVLQAEGAVLIDIREPDEVAGGSPVAAVHLSRAYLELQIEDVVPEFDMPLLILCSSGVRSLFAASELRRLGYRTVSSVAGGFNRWKDAGLPFELPRVLDARARERYARHLLMPEVGVAGQLRLLESRVLLIGAGGLGAPAALYLAAAGVGTLGIVDHDVVDRSNLQRQVIHAEERIGQPKVESAREAIQALNPDIELALYRTRLDSDNIDEIVAGYQVVIDGTDNFATRYLINDACIKHGIPNVHGSIFRFDGQVSVFWPARPDRPGPCYRCLYPEPPPPELAPSCAEAGVLGVLPGVIGLLQAVETIKLLLALGEPLCGRLLQFDALAGRFQEFTLAADPACSHCSGKQPFPGYADYAAFCNGSGLTAP
jgi:molybdopterin/thiamine biosynthesis adenylyltransferase/rhodanese-related sulfurtransferase/molybdopterin converting factor small subunit